ncbi:hypothetical protein RWE15_09105 [Virgibacillus halophilus]|uniref:Uncharacterized protein n=1 Tax=Tigheibacillus halophilus TaxID=361280 RepID=A0ABU5C678_9BACI|nr:hypothetical protein [Virgibacillus halophilus]
MVQKYADTAKPELITCERLLNRLISCDFPTIHQKNWDLREELVAIETGYNQCTITIDSIFQVDKVSNNVVTVTNLDTSWTYQLTEMPIRMIKPGMLLHGNIGKKSSDICWTWFVTKGVYPAKAKNYIVFVD